MQSYDPAGQWVIWKLRDDWQRTSIGMTLDAAPAVKYVVYRNAGNPDARVIEQMNHNLDVINDIAPEGMFTIARQAGETAAYWFDGFPFAHPDPTLPSVIFNHQVPPFDNQDVRWALALMIDIRSVAMGSYRGAANIAALSVPPTGTAVGRLLRADAGVAERLRARHRHAQDQALRSDRRRADRRAGAPAVGRRRSPRTRPS